MKITTAARISFIALLLTALGKAHALPPTELSKRTTDYFLDDSVSGFALYPGPGYRSYVDARFMIKSLNDLEDRLSKLPMGTRLSWSPYRTDSSGAPVLFKEGQFAEFRKFCVEHGIKLNVITVTQSLSQAGGAEESCPAEMKPSDVPDLDHEIALAWEASGWTVYQKPQLRADFNNDGKKDLALLCRTNKGIQFIVLWSGKLHIDLGEIFNQDKAKGHEIMKTYCDSHIRSEGIACDSPIKLGKGKGVDMGGGEDYHCQASGDMRVWTNLGGGGD
jgi:hypothetical protein